jgi:DDE superfamily endonuclease
LTLECHLHRAAATGLPTLADPGYDGAGIGVHIPVRQPADGRDLDINTRTRNALLRSQRCLGERGFALLTTGRWRTLQHITASPSKISDIARAALVLTHFEYGYQLKFAEITSVTRALYWGSSVKSTHRCAAKKGGGSV